MADVPIILHVDTPVIVRYLKTHEEMMCWVESRSKALIELEGDRDHFPEYVAIETSEAIVVLNVQIFSVSPEFRQTNEPGTWLVGFDDRVSGIGWDPPGVAFSLVLPGPFRGFYDTGDGHTLVAHELGVILIETGGQELWRFDRSEVLAHVRLDRRVLRLGYRDGQIVALDLGTGKVLRG